MMRTKTPMALWDYCASYVVDITCFTANTIYVLHGRTPHEMVTGNTPDISEYTEFSWYEPIYYYDDVTFPEAKRNIARWLGIAHRVGQALCYWVLTNTGQVIARTTVQKLSNEEKLSSVIQDELRTFDKHVTDRLPEYTPDADDLFMNPKDIYDVACDEPFEQESAMPEQDDYPDAETYDQYITAQVLLPRGDTMEKGTVLRRKRDSNGTLIGHAHSNPILDTRVFEVIFPDGHVAEYATNVIAENMYAMVDEEGYETAIMKSNIDHRCDYTKALSK
jgi:hypothetical protein